MMKMSESIQAIAKALVEVQKSLPSLTKDRENPITRSKYVTLDAINKALLPITSANGLAVTQYPVVRDGRIGCGTLVVHTSGEYIDFGEYTINNESNKRMTAAQEGGSTITYAKRYQLSAIFGIVTDEDTDGNGSPQHRQGQRQRGSRSPQGQPRQSHQSSGQPNQSRPAAATNQQRTALMSLFKQASEATGTSLSSVQGYYLGQFNVNNIAQLSALQTGEIAEVVKQKLAEVSK